MACRKYMNLHILYIFQVLYSTIQHQQEAVIITDALMQIQYANKAAERLLHTKIVRDILHLCVQYRNKMNLLRILG